MLKVADSACCGSAIVRPGATTEEALAAADCPERVSRAVEGTGPADGGTYGGSVSPSVALCFLLDCHFGIQGKEEVTIHDLGEMTKVYNLQPTGRAHGRRFRRLLNRAISLWKLHGGSSGDS